MGRDKMMCDTCNKEHTPSKFKKGYILIYKGKEDKSPPGGSTSWNWIPEKEYEIEAINPHSNAYWFSDDNTHSTWGWDSDFVENDFIKKEPTKWERLLT